MRLKNFDHPIFVLYLLFCLLIGSVSTKAWGLFTFVLQDTENQLSYSELAREFRERTSLEMQDKIKKFSFENLKKKSSWSYPWLFSPSESFLLNQKNHLRPVFIRWLSKGGTAVFEGQKSKISLEYSTQAAVMVGARWQKISPEHELMRSFYLLKDLPSCSQEHQPWWEYRMDERMALLQIPPGFLKALATPPSPNSCSQVSKELLIRTMVNIVMVILTTDYKKDQIHLPEILKRIRK